MSRFRRVVHGVASGYLLLAATAVYSLAAVPVALHYLSQQRFGLWTLMSGIASYLSLMDLGMTSSVARLLIDHKDHREGGGYGSLIKTAWLALVVQGAVACLVGVVLSPWFAQLLRIPADLQADFIALLRWQSLALGLSFATRIFLQILNAHQRMDLSNHIQSISLALNFLLLWVFFHLGCDVFSLAWAGLVTTLVGAAVCLAACFRLRLFPRAGAWGQASWPLFRELFGYGKDMFLVGLGTQLMVGSQSLILTRQLGLEAAAAWNVGTRTFNLVSQAVWRIFDSSVPALSEMLVRRETEALRERYRAVVILTASCCGFVAIVFALCNSAFVAVWTNHKIVWPFHNDLLLGLWMLPIALQHCHICFVLLTKDIRFARFIYFVEGLIFVVLASLTVGSGGLSAMIASSLLCTTFISAAYGIWRVRDYFGFRLTEIAFDWLRPLGRLLLRFLPTAVVIAWATLTLPSASLRLTVESLTGGCLGLWFLLRFGLTRSFQQELLGRSSARVKPWLHWAFFGTRSS
jgi:O-antigen/teichoic acid export membrane protein